MNGNRTAETGGRFRQLRLLSLAIALFAIAGCITAAFSHHRGLRYTGPAIFAAAQDGDLRGVQSALDQRPDWIRLQNSRGLTALHLAAAAGHPAVVDLLLQRGANVNARDRAGQTPLALAEINHQDEAAQRLRAHGGR